MKRAAGLTLVELLIAVTLFSLVVGSALSVVGSLRRTESFRDATSLLTREASLAAETIAQTVKDAEGYELVDFGGSKLCVRGFYLQSVDPRAVAEGSLTLTTLALARSRDELGRTTTRLDRRDFSLVGSDVVETRYQSQTPYAGFGCAPVAWGPPIGERKLTSRVAVTKFHLRAIAARGLDGADSSRPTVSPFVSLELVVSPLSPKNGIAPFGLRTTLTPSFIHSGYDAPI